MKIWTIYIIKNIIDSRVYIGQTNQKLRARYLRHRYAKTYLGNAMRLYGYDKFYIEEIGICYTIDDANFLEEAFIEKYKSDNKEYGFNIKRGGNCSKINIAARAIRSYKMRGIDYISEREMELFIIKKMPFDELIEIKNGINYNYSDYIVSEIRKNEYKHCNTCKNNIITDEFYKSKCKTCTKRAQKYNISERNKLRRRRTSFNDI